MSKIDMKRAVRMNGWCFAGDERTIQTSVQKLTEKGLELQLTLGDEDVVGKIVIDLAQDAKGGLILGLKVTTESDHGFELKRIDLIKNGMLLSPLAD